MMAALNIRTAIIKSKDICKKKILASDRFGEIGIITGHPCSQKTELAAERT